MIKNIIFDFDGVILESVNIKTDAFAELFKHYPNHLENILNHHKNNSGISRYEKIEYYLNMIFSSKYDSETYNNYINKFGKLIYDKICNASFVPGALEFLTKNKDIFNMFIASATPEDELKKIIKEKKSVDILKVFMGHHQKKLN